jgi:hypothetical protein
VIKCRDRRAPNLFQQIKKRLAVKPGHRSHKGFSDHAAVFAPKADHGIIGRLYDEVFGGINSGCILG